MKKKDSVEKKKSTYNHAVTDVCIYIMGGLGIYLALGSVLSGSLIGILMLGIIPAFLSIMFMVFKHPIYGILYTISFIYNRSNMFTDINAYPIVYVMVILLILFFADVDYRSYVKWKEQKKELKNKTQK